MFTDVYYINNGSNIISLMNITGTIIYRYFVDCYFLDKNIESFLYKFSYTVLLLTVYYIVQRSIDSERLKIIKSLL